MNKRKNLNTLRVLTCLLLCTGILYSCKKDKAAEGTDKELYDLSKSSDGFVWYKNSATLLAKSTGSGHPQPWLRTRYNAVAATQLDANGKILTGAVFPEGSLIVKELHESQTKLDRYAILYKKTGSADADANGWIWGYINANGTVSEPASNKGTSCISCHSQVDNIDYMLMNKYFP